MVFVQQGWISKREMEQVSASKRELKHQIKMLESKEDAMRNQNCPEEDVVRKDTKTVVRKKLEPAEYALGWWWLEH